MFKSVSVSSYINSPLMIHRYSILRHTLADFKALVAAAHARGLRIVLDMVLNHTSDQHPWFQGALQGPLSQIRNAG